MFQTARTTPAPTARHGVRRRRLFSLAGAGAALLAGSAFARVWPSAATQAQAAGARVAIDLPPIFKDGNSVPLAVEVASPMTPSDHVRELHITAPGNPLPEIARFRFSTRNGRAEVRTRIRLDAGLQSVVVTAAFSDGSVETARAAARITVGGCSTS